MLPHRYQSKKCPNPNPPVHPLQCMIKLPIRLLPIIPRIKLANRTEVIPPFFPKLIGKGTSQPKPVFFFLSNINPALHNLLD